MRRRIDDFRPMVADRIAFLDRGKGINVPDVQSAIEKVYSEINRETPTIEILSAKDLGAMGDGVSDDTIAIQNAINQIALSGGVLYFPKGKYRITRPITIAGVQGNFSIVGAGSSTIFDASALDKDERAIQFHGKSESISTVIGIINKGETEITVNSTEGLSIGDMVRLVSNENFNDQRPDHYFKSEINFVENIINNTILLKYPLYDSYDGQNYSIELVKITPIKNVELKNFKIVMRGSGYNQTAITISRFHNVTVNGVSIENADRAGIWLDTGINATTTNCYVARARDPILGYGIFYTAVQQGIISNNHGEDCRHSIEVGGDVSRDISIIGNTVKGDIDRGIATHGSTEYISIIGNHIHDTVGGIVVRGRSNVISLNTIKNISGGPGIIIGEANDDTKRKGEAGKNLIVTNNIVQSVERNGIWCAVSLENAIISNNIFVDCAKQTGYDAVLINGYKQHNVSLTGNKIIGASRNGILIEPHENVREDGSNQESVLISGNYIKANQKGIVIYGNPVNSEKLSSNIIIKDNIIKTGNRGIEFKGGFFHNTDIVYNHIDSGNFASVHIEPGTMPMNDEKIDNNRLSTP